MGIHPAELRVLSPGGTHAYECRLRHIRPQPTVSIRRRCCSDGVGSTLSEMLDGLGRFLKTHSIHPSGPAFTRWHSTRTEDHEIEVGYPVCMPVAGAGEVHAGTLPGGEVVATNPFGPLGDVVDAGKALDQWCAEHGRSAAGPDWELHWAEPGPRLGSVSWRTELVRPLSSQ